jgi:hypothetical protein
MLATAMKNATLILAVVCVLSSCAGERGGSKTTPKVTTTGSKDNTVFSWLSTTSVPQTVSR